MITQRGNKIIFRYDTVERNGVETPRTRCIIEGSDKSIIASSTVHLKQGENGDQHDKKAARRFAFEKVMNGIETDKETRRDLWLSFFSNIRQPIGKEVNVDNLIPREETSTEAIPENV